MRDFIIEVCTLSNQTTSDNAKMLGVDRRLLSNYDRVYYVQDTLSPSQIITAFEDGRCSRAEPHPKFVITDIPVPDSEIFVTKPTFWVDTTMDQFFQTARSILAKDHLGRIIPSVSSLRRVFVK